MNCPWVRQINGAGSICKQKEKEKEIININSALKIKIEFINTILWNYTIHKNIDTSQAKKIKSDQFHYKTAYQVIDHT